MPTERIQRQIDRLLDDIESARTVGDWQSVEALAGEVLDLDPENEDGKAFLAAARRRLQRLGSDAAEATSQTNTERGPSAPLPESFAAGRYRVERFLGEGGRKRVYLAHDTRLDRDVAVAVIKTEGLDEAGLERVQREAQAMARLGDHPHIVTVFDVAEEGGQRILVSQYMSGGSVEDLIAKAEDHRLPLADTLRIAEQACQALDYAHEQGVVHRDLKPGNVWLSDPNTAKLGDFGLAVALNRSRVTMAGMMLGTVAYMPPEQALGGEVTPKADLYSLGCMLYEMVTGRPPFLGDDPTAVISQHMNTPPVAPSWLTDSCPPDLEELILSLLAKAPGDRPASAAEVRQALLRIDPEKKSASHSDSSENPLERLARGVFVGRQAELERLRKAFDDAFAGRGGLVIVVGEPGIGKTRTTQELETYARMRGAQVLWGRTHETGGAPAYWPWYQIGNQFAAANDIASVIAPHLPPGAGPELSRIFPWLRQQPNFVEPEPIVDPESAQFRLFDAYASFLRAMAMNGPLVIALDDLHWADKASLLLLQHIARDLSRLRILVVGNYRDTDVTRQSALSETLAVLNRESGFERIVLRGLSREEVAGYIQATANVRPGREVVERIFEETEGNAFFLSEVVNLMAQEGTLTRESVSDIRIPDGVREALGRRLNLLSDETNELLQIAAIVGREFTYDMLTLLGKQEEDVLLALIEEGLDARVIEELPQPGRYRFSHAQMQETLLAELSTTRRVRLHGQVGEALEQRWGPEVARERPSRLAAHFAEAASMSSRFAEKAVLYSKLAAREAESRPAWDEAARHYEVALGLLEGAGDGSPAELAALHEAAGMARNASTQTREAWRHLMRAIEIYARIGDWNGQARCIIEIFRINVAPERRSALFDQVQAAPGQREPRYEAQFLALSSDARDHDRAMWLAEEHKLDDVRPFLLFRRAGNAHFDGRHAEAESMYVEAQRALESVGNATYAAQAALTIGWIRWTLGEIAGASESFRAAARLGTKIGDAYSQDNAMYSLAMIETHLGHSREARQILDAVPDRGNNYWRGLVLAALALTSGEAPDLEAAMPKSSPAFQQIPLMASHLHGIRSRVLYNFAGREAAAEDFAISLKASRIQISLSRAAQSYISIGTPGEAFLGLGTLDEVREIYDLYAAVPHVRCLFAGTADVLRGMLALHLGLTAEAEEWYNAGLEWCQREGYVVDAGRCHQGLAEVAAARGETREALAHLDDAIAVFQKHSAKLCLGQALAMKVRLQGIGSGTGTIDAVAQSVQDERLDLAPVAAPDGTVTVFVCDIEDSTELNERLGDRRWLEVLREHNAIVRRRLAAHGGQEVKTIGDAFMVVFADPLEALHCAVEIQRDFVGWDKEPPIKVRVGLHVGVALLDSDDFFGTNVTLAFRIAALGAGGQVLVSSALKELTQASSAFQFDAGRLVELKGLSGKHPVYEVLWD